MDITFDPVKSEKNLRERGLPFDRASDFDFGNAVIARDSRRAYPEPRFVAVGWLDARLHVLCFTPTEAGIRVISLRRANRREQNAYERQTAPHG